jgi:hypothetical protein
MNLEQSVEWKIAGETQVLGENPPQCQLWAPRIPHGLNWDQNRTAVDRNRLLTFWVMARPCFLTITRLIFVTLYSSRVDEFMDIGTFLNTRRMIVRLNILSFWESFFVQIISLILVSKQSPNFCAENLNISKIWGGGGQIHIVTSEYSEPCYNVHSPIIPISCPVLQDERYVRYVASSGRWPLQHTPLYLERLLNNAIATYGQQVPLWVLWGSTGWNRTPSSTFLYNNRSVCTSNTYRRSFMLHGVYELRRKHHYSAYTSVRISHSCSWTGWITSSIQYAGRNGRSECPVHFPSRFIRMVKHSAILRHWLLKIYDTLCNHDKCRILGSDTSGYEPLYLLGYNAL